jgi:hypothetical protein
MNCRRFKRVCNDTCIQTWNSSLVYSCVVHLNLLVINKCFIYSTVRDIHFTCIAINHFYTRGITLLSDTDKHVSFYHFHTFLILCILGDSKITFDSKYKKKFWIYSWGPPHLQKNKETWLLPPRTRSITFALSIHFTKKTKIICKKVATFKKK